MSTGPQKTLRLKIPQWQGGDNAPAAFGAELLAFLAPESESPLIEIPVEAYSERDTVIQEGVAHRDAIMKQLNATKKVLDEHQPESFDRYSLTNQIQKRTRTKLFRQEKWIYRTWSG